MSGGNWKDFYLAARDGNLDLVRYHVQQGVDVDYAHPEFMSTALVAAIQADHRAVAQYLIDSGADPCLMSDLDRVTPIEAASQIGMTLRLP